MTEPMTPREAEFEARRIIFDAFAAPVPSRTSYRDSTPPAPTGAAPVPQPETRVVPQWATGAAVASIGIGAGAVGIGCAVWLAAQGLAAITLTGVLAALAPFVGVALVVVAVGAAVSRAGRSRPAPTTNVYTGSVTRTTEVTSHTRGMFSRSRTEVNG